MASVSQHANQRTGASERRQAAPKGGIATSPPKNSRGTREKDFSKGGQSSSKNHSPTDTKSNETTYLQQKLRDVLDKQVLTDEQHQQNMITTRQVLRRLYDDNANLRNIIAAAEFRKRNQGLVSSPEDPASVTDAEVGILSNRIHLARRSYNRLQHELVKQTEALHREMLKERESQRVLRATAGVLDPAAMEAALSGSNALSLRIQRIERQLNEVLAKQRVVGMITDGYRHHIQDLEKEKAEYDNQIHALETQYADRHKDHLRLITLYQNAEYDYEKMVAQRTAYTQHVKKQRRLKERLLVDRRSEVQQALLETERRNRALVDLQMQHEEEAQLLEEAEAAHHEMMERIARQRNVDSVLASGGVSSGTPRGGATGDAENEEKLSAYHLAIQELLKETKAESRQSLLPIFRAEVEQYEQLRAQVDTKRQRQERLEEEVRRLRERYKNARVCAGTNSGSHSSVILEEELRTFLAESEKELAETVKEEENRRLRLRDLAMQGNQMARLLSAYRSEVPIRPMRETDPHLPIHFTALTQKILSLADEATRGAGPDGIPPPAAAIPLLIPENNVRVPLRKGSGTVASSGKDEGKRKKIASMASSAAATLLQQQRRGHAASEESSVLDDSGFDLTRDELHGAAQPPTVTSDLDDSSADDRSSSSNSSNEGGGGYRDFNAASLGAVQLPPRPGKLARPASAQVRSGRGGSVPTGRCSSVVSDEPLQRQELKQVSMVIKERERKRLLNEERRLASLGKDMK